jgi:hypothetical protein
MTSRSALLTVLVGDHVGRRARRFEPAPEEIQAASRVQTPAARPPTIEEPQLGEAKGGDAECCPRPGQAPEQLVDRPVQSVPVPPTGPDFSSSNPRHRHREAECETRRNLPLSRSMDPASWWVGHGYDVHDVIDALEPEPAQGRDAPGRSTPNRLGRRPALSPAGPTGRHRPVAGERRDSVIYSRRVALEAVLDCEGPW